MNVKSTLHSRPLIVILIITTVAILFFGKSAFETVSKISPILNPEGAGAIPGFKTNTNKKSVGLEKLLSGGPGKDGIPAINEPKFTTISQTSVKDDVTGILIDMNGGRRFYPYTIMVWHEIVNDSIGNNHFAITFCPLCGSAIVFDRNVNGKTLRFGVSGLLYESNLVMYDNETESLWSQTRGEAIVGDYTGTKLKILPFQAITLSELKRKYPDSKVLSQDTGYSRDYSYNPYGNYDANQEIYFPVSTSDERFPAKEIMFIIPYKDKSIAFEQLKLKDGQTSEFKINGDTLTAKRSGGELDVIDSKGEKLPGYYEMWFSWAIHHQQNGAIWKVE